MLKCKILCIPNSEGLIGLAYSEPFEKHFVSGGRGQWGELISKRMRVKPKSSFPDLVDLSLTLSSTCNRDIMVRV